MRALRVLVIVMAVMILAGLAVLVIVIAGRIPRSGPGTAPQEPFAAAPIELPAGARIETMSVGSDRLALAILLPDGERRVIIIELATGRALGTIPLRTAP